MYFLFIDESGNPDKVSEPAKEGDTPLFCLVGVSLKIQYQKTFNSFYNHLRRNMFPSIMQRQIPTNPKRAKLIREAQELKDILKPSNADNKRNQRFMHLLLRHCMEKCNITIHPVIFLKDQLDNEPSGTWIYPLALKRIMTSFNNFLVTKSDIGILILDSRGPIADDALIANYYSHTSKNPFGIACNNVIGPPFFARSHMTFGLQIAHHISHIVFGCYYESYYPKRGGRDYSHIRQYWNMLANRALHGTTNKLKGIIVWE